MKKFFAMPRDGHGSLAIQYRVETHRGLTALVLTKQEYKLVQMLCLRDFPAEWVDQETGKSYDLYDAFEVDDDLVATYITE